MACLPSLHGCSHSESVSLLETKGSLVQEKLPLIHFCLFSQPTCLFKVEQNLLTDAARPGSVTAGWVLACGGLIHLTRKHLDPVGIRLKTSRFISRLRFPPRYHVSGDCSCHPGLRALLYQAAFPLCGIRKPAVVVGIISYCVKS